MARSPTATTDLERLVSIALLGLAGCALTIAMTTTSDQLGTARTIGTFAGLFLGFVAMAGVLDTLGGDGSR